jgi:hypothetical protein
MNTFSMLQKAVYTLTLFMFVIEVIEPSTAFVRAAEFKISPVVSQFQSKAGVSQKDHKQAAEASYQAPDSTGDQGQEGDTVLVSHYSGAAWSYQFSLPLYKVSALYLYIKRLMGTSFSPLLRPPILS